MNIVIEKAENNYSAYSPNVDGCIATGDTLFETIHNYAEALKFHLDGILSDTGEE